MVLTGQVNEPVWTCMYFGWQDRKQNVPELKMAALQTWQIIIRVKKKKITAANVYVYQSLLSLECVTKF